MIRSLAARLQINVHTCSGSSRRAVDSVDNAWAGGGITDQITQFPFNELHGVSSALQKVVGQEWALPKNVLMSAPCDIAWIPRL